MSDKNIDKKIEELFAVVKAQKIEVEKAEKESKRSWNTNCSFKLYGSTPVNLQTASEDNIFKSLTLNADTSPLINLFNCTTFLFFNNFFCSSLNSCCFVGFIFLSTSIPLNKILLMITI